LARSRSLEKAQKPGSQQLQHVLSQVPELIKIPEVLAPEASAEEGKGEPAATKPVGSLASHIKAKGGDTNQLQRFMATADWLRLKGETALKTGLISKALAENHQKKLSNPADCLNKSVSKGHCEKNGDGFFITPEGLKTLGHND
jgi:hypothetical protein